MGKIDAYTQRINDILEATSFRQLNDESGRTEILNKLVDAFSKIYRGPFITKHDCQDDEGFAIIPGTIRANGGKEYVALLDICVQDSGEHYGTQILHQTYGVLQQKDFKKKLSEEEYSEMFPYKYRPAVEIVGDIHQSHYY